MSIQRLALATTLLAAAARAAQPTTVLGFPEVAGPHRDLQILGTSGDTTTYKLELDPVPEAPQKETWTVTVGPANIVAHGVLEPGPGTTDTVDRSCAIVKGSVLKECDEKVTAAKAGLTPEQEKDIEAGNKLGPQPLPTEGAEAITLVPLKVGPDAPGGEAAPGAAPGGAMGPMQTGSPLALGGGPSSEGGEGSASGPASGGGKKKDKKPDAGADSPPAGAATGMPPPASGTSNKSPKASNGAPPPAMQTTSGASRFGVTATVPLFLLGLAAVLVL